MQIGEPTKVDRQVSNKKSWLIIELRDETDTPVPDEEFELLCRGKVHQRGHLDANGRVKIVDLPLGRYSVRFPRRWGCRAK